MATEYHPNTRTCSAWFTNGKENESQTMTFSPKVRREIQPPWMTDISHSSTKFNFSIVRKINNPARFGPVSSLPRSQLIE
jgi:hypothetical protein